MTTNDSTSSTTNTNASSFVDISQQLVVWWIVAVALVVNDAFHQTKRPVRADNHHNHTALVTCLLWLVASTALPPPPTAAATTPEPPMTTVSAVQLWLHVAFGALLVAHHAGQQPQQRQQQRQRLSLQHLVQHVAPAAWMALSTQLLFVPVATATEATRASLATFLLTWTVNTAWSSSRSSSSRYHRPQHPDTTMPAVVYYASSSATTPTTLVPPQRLDESHWYEWTPHQVADWIHQQQQQKYYDPSFVWDADEEQIAGHQLPRLAVGDWRSLKCPMGVALQLYDAIQGLVQQYPMPAVYHQYPPYHSNNNGGGHDMATTTTTTTTTTGWLEELDRQQQQQQQSASLAFAKSSSSSNRDHSFYPPEEEQAVQTIWKNRYDFLELPTLRQRASVVPPPPQQQHYPNGTMFYPQDNPVTLSKTAAHIDLTTTLATTSPSTNITATPNVSFHHHQDTDPLLSSLVQPKLDTSDNNNPHILPAHIADIVRRKPHLLQTLLEQRERERREPTPPHRPPRRTNMPTMSIPEDEQNDDDDDDDDDDNEFTELLASPHETNHQAIEYQSTR